MNAQLLSHVQLCSTMEHSPLGFLCPWDFPGKNTGMGCHLLLQGIFPTQGWNPFSVAPALSCRVLYHWATWETQLLNITPYFFVRIRHVYYLNRLYKLLSCFQDMIMLFYSSSSPLGTCLTVFIKYFLVEKSQRSLFY